MSGLDTIVNTECPCPCPPKPKPKPAPHDLPTRNVVLTKEFNKVLYSLAVRTTTDAVFDTKYKYTLTEMLCDISDALITNFEKIAQVSEAFNALMADCPEEFDTLKEIADYININGDPKSALIELIDTKVDKEEGKGLSTHDLTDVLFEKLTNDYTREELDVLFNQVTTRIVTLERANNIQFSTEEPEGIKSKDIWFQSISEYRPN
jgi:hypothetical protein